MLELSYLKKFIYSHKDLSNYVKKLTSVQLTNLLSDVEEIRKTKQRKNDKNSAIRQLKRNLSAADYSQLMDKLEIFPHESQVFALTNKELFLNFISVLSTSLLAFFGGFVGLLTALGMVFSLQIVGVLFVAVFVISLAIALTWDYQLRTINKESSENKKFLNFQIEILKKYNFNKINKILTAINNLREKLGLNPEKIDYEKLKETQIINLIASSLLAIHENFRKTHAHTNVSTSSASTQSSGEKNKKWNAELAHLTELLKQGGVNKAFSIIKYADNPIDNPGFMKWFRSDTSRILSKLFNESKNLLASVALGSVLGLVALKLLAQVALLTTLLTTFLGIGILVGIIVVVVLVSTAFTIYNIYKKSKRANIKTNTQSIIDQEKQIKDQFDAIEKNLTRLIALVEDNSSFKMYDTVFMQKLISGDANKLLELISLLQNKKLPYDDGLNTRLSNNPLLIIKLIKKIKDNIISNQQELNEFLKASEAKSGIGLTPILMKKEAATQELSSSSSQGLQNAFQAAAGDISQLTDRQLIDAMKFIENQTDLEMAYKFKEDNFQIIQNIAVEVAKRLSSSNFQNEKKPSALRSILESCKSMRKKVISVLVDENRALGMQMDNFIGTLKKHNLPSSTEEDREGSRNFFPNIMSSIRQTLEFDPQTVTINELIDKKQSMGRGYVEKTQNKHFSFWHGSYSAQQKLEETLSQANVKLNQFVNS